MYRRILTDLLKLSAHCTLKRPVLVERIEGLRWIAALGVAPSVLRLSEGGLVEWVGAERAVRRVRHAAPALESGCCVH